MEWPENAFETGRNSWQIPKKIPGFQWEEPDRDSHELLQTLGGRQETFILDQGVPLEKRQGYLWNTGGRGSRVIPQNLSGTPQEAPLDRN